MADDKNKRREPPPPPPPPPSRMIPNTVQNGDKDKKTREKV